MRYCRTRTSPTFMRSCSRFRVRGRRKTFRSSTIEGGKRSRIDSGTSVRPKRGGLCASANDAWEEARPGKRSDIVFGKSNRCLSFKGELPQYEVTGFPISPLQMSIQEESPNSE